MKIKSTVKVDGMQDAGNITESEHEESSLIINSHAKINNLTIYTWLGNSWQAERSGGKVNQVLGWQFGGDYNLLLQVQWTNSGGITSLTSL